MPFDAAPSLAVAPLSDVEAIDRILRDPWIAPKITYDGRDAAYVEHPNLDYFGAYVCGKLVGVFMRVRFTAIEVEVHAALLREALPYSRQLGRLFLDRIFADPGVLRVTAHTIGSLQSAVNYCLKLGFVREGERRNASIQNGRLLPVVTLGLLREDHFRNSAALAQHR
jgi:hypothetical protein